VKEEHTVEGREKKEKEGVQCDVQSEPFFVVYEYRNLLKIGSNSLEKRKKTSMEMSVFRCLPGIFCGSLEKQTKII
jgi:hypothetical protein